MEQEKLNDNCLVWIKSLPQNLLHAVIEFLDVEDLQQIKQAYTVSSEKTSRLATLSSTKSFISTFINKTDRSIYMSFYNETQLQKMQSIHVRNLDSHSPDIFSLEDQKLKKILKDLQHEINLFERCTEIREQLRMALCDPQLPFPKMRREGIGMFCNSPFQFFLVNKRFGLEEPYLTECFQDLKNFVQVIRETKVESQLTVINQDQDRIRIFHQVRYTPQLITLVNYEEFIVKEDILNNLVVFLFALTSGMVKSMDLYIQSFHDPFATHVEILLRYNIFRNFVLNIEEKCSFIFENYNEAAEQILGKQQNEPKFCFWRPAMSIWYRTMSKYHEGANQMFTYILTKIRVEHLLNNFGDLLENVPFTGMSIRNKLQLKEFELGLRDSIFNCETDNSGMQGYFIKEPTLYEQLCRDYMQYIMDLSINELTVHWCGHSQHILDEPHQEFEDSFMQYNENYYHYLKKIIFSKQNGPSERYVYRKILEKQLSFLTQGYIKPILLKNVALRSNQLIQNCLDKHYQQWASTNHSQTASFEEPQSPLSKLDYTTQQQDKILNYYNDRDRPSDMKESRSVLPLHQNLNSSQRLLFSISASPESKVLVKSLDMIVQSIRMKDITPRLQKIDSVEKSISELADYFLSNEVEEMEFTQDDLLVFGKVTSFSSKQIQIYQNQKIMSISDILQPKDYSKVEQIMDLFPVNISMYGSKMLEMELQDN